MISWPGRRPRSLLRSLGRVLPELGGEALDGQVDVVIHPQSTVHAMIEYSDGSVIAQISATDMRMPIQYALTYPDRRGSDLPPLDLAVEEIPVLPADWHSPRVPLGSLVPATATATPTE